MSVHNQNVGKTDEWYTPLHVFDALGCRFDIDVSAPNDLRYVSTPTSRWISTDSLEHDWQGFVWMNPPFGGRNGIAPWLAKFFAHGNGIALAPDRTSAPWWQEFSRRADAILFTAGKIKFIGIDGHPGKSPADGTTLFAAGPRAVKALRRGAASGLGLLVTPAPPSPIGGEQP